MEFASYISNRNKLNRVKLVILPLILLFTYNIKAQVGINNSSPNTKAALDVTSNSMGFLPPRMTAAQRNTISNPIPAGLVVWCLDCGNNGQMQVYNGASWTDMTGEPAASFLCGTTTISFVYGGNVVTYGTVLNPATNKCWLDRNLGATQVATSSTDATSYGDLFQWGRYSDGHQIRTSGTTPVLSLTDTPGHGNFITISGEPIPFDWRAPPNNLMWQGINSINNVCPSGYRLPTQTEFDAERLSWVSNNPAGAFASPLKLSLTGFRDGLNGNLGLSGQYGYYRTNTVAGVYSPYLYFGGNTAGVSSTSRAHGWAVRCIKDLQNDYI